MKKLIISSMLMVCAIGYCFAQKVTSDICYAVNESKPLTLKYFLNSNGEDCFVNLRLIIGSTDVLKPGDVLRFKCEDGTTQDITCTQDIVDNSDDDGFHVASVKQEFIQHLKGGISSINVTHENATFELGLRRYTNSITKKAAHDIYAHAQKIFERRQDSINRREMAIADSIRRREMAIQDSINRREMAITDSINRSKQRERVIAAYKERGIAIQANTAKPNARVASIGTISAAVEATRLEVNAARAGAKTPGYNTTFAGNRAAQPTYQMTTDAEKGRRNASTPNLYGTEAYAKNNIVYIDYAPTFFLWTPRGVGHAVSLNYLRRISLTRTAPFFLELGAGLQFLKAPDKKDAHPERSVRYLNVMIPINFSFVHRVSKDFAVSPYVGASLCINTEAGGNQEANDGWSSSKAKDALTGRVVNGGPQIGLNAEYKNIFMGAGIHAIFGYMGDMRDSMFETDLGIDLKLGITF